jgi:hypothetical protein
MFSDLVAGHGGKQMPDKVRKRIQEPDRNSGKAERPRVGQFLEIGADEEHTDLIAEITQVDTVGGQPIITAHIKNQASDKTPIFAKPGSIKRKGPNYRGVHHWIIYHPGAKLLLGIASGTRCFSDQVYGGQEKSREVAVQTLESWRQACLREVETLQNPQICLCPNIDCPNRKITEVGGKPVRHITAWKLVHETSLEHQLGFARDVGSKLSAKRAAAMDTRCERVKGRTSGDARMRVSAPPSPNSPQ